MADFDRRFAREPLNPHDAHRPLRPHKNLKRVLTWQEERRLTGNLTVHYKRVMYVIEPSEAAESARGKRVLVVESEDDAVRIEYRGVELSLRARSPSWMRAWIRQPSSTTRPFPDHVRARAPLNGGCT